MRVIRRPPAVDRSLLELSALRFEPVDPVFDLRLARRRRRAVGAAGALTGVGMGAGRGRGQVDRRRLGGPRCRPVAGGAAGAARGGARRPAGAESGSARGVDERRRLWAVGARSPARVCRFALAEGVARPRANQLELKLVDAWTGEDARGRTALIRRLAFASDGPAAFDELRHTATSRDRARARHGPDRARRPDGRVLLDAAERERALGSPPFSQPGRRGVVPRCRCPALRRAGSIRRGSERTRAPPGRTQ